MPDPTERSGERVWNPDCALVLGCWPLLLPSCPLGLISPRQAGRQITRRWASPFLRTKEPHPTRPHQSSTLSPNSTRGQRRLPQSAPRSKLSPHPEGTVDGLGVGTPSPYTLLLVCSHEGMCMPSQA